MEHAGVINATKGQVIHLSRPSNPTTGYVYDILLSPGLSLLHHEYVSSREAPMPGAGGTDVWSIRVDGKGYILLWYHRTWEQPNLSNAELITVNIDELTVYAAGRVCKW
jgi:predicted secreted protein